MRVTCADGTVFTYLDRYMLELVSYNIFDETEDGTFEPMRTSHHQKYRGTKYR